jgi:deoxycytidine triphosphate deaminase
VVTLELFNMMPVPIQLVAGAPICQIIFNELKTPVEHGYCGQYQNAMGVEASKGAK